MVSCARLMPLQTLSRKWAYVVLCCLRQPKSFSELQRAIKHISNRMLDLELKKLVEEGLIRDGEKYSLTPEGVAFCDSYESMVKWGERYRGAPSCMQGDPCAGCEEHIRKKRHP